MGVRWRKYIFSGTIERELFRGVKFCNNPSKKHNCNHYLHKLRGVRKLRAERANSSS